MPCIGPHWTSSSIVIPGRYSLFLRSLMRLAYTLTASLNLSPTKLQANNIAEHQLTALCIQLIEAVLCCLQPCSELLFPSRRKENRAVQVVEVQAQSRKGANAMRPYTFTFCLERIDVGPYKVCTSRPSPSVPSEQDV